jgi:hypothetical protein
MVAQVGYSVVGRLRGWVTLCAVYTVHVEMRSAEFLIEPQNQGRRFVSSLASKSLGCFLRFGHKTGGNVFSSLASKSVATVSYLSLKIKVVEGFPVWVSKSAAIIW